MALPFSTVASHHEDETRKAVDTGEVGLRCAEQVKVMKVQTIDREFTAKEVQNILRKLTSGEEKIGLALLNYYARTNLVPSTGREISRGRNKYCYADVILLCWLFRTSIVIIFGFPFTIDTNDWIHTRR